MINPKRKVRVFISSKCGDRPEDERYNKVREALKRNIESSGLADVWLFEDQGATTYPVEKQFLYALEDTDVCIFLVDNEDGIPGGVQKEIDQAKKHNKRSLSYFCKESSDEKTIVQKDGTGSSMARHVTVEKFQDFSEHGANDIIQEIIDIYRHYCSRRLVFLDDEEEAIVEKFDWQKWDSQIYLDKETLGNISESKRYIENILTGSFDEVGDSNVNSNLLDSALRSFLPEIFGDRSKGTQNKLNSLFEEFNNLRPEDAYLEVVSLRYKAIKAYMRGDRIDCITCLEMALAKAEERDIAEWLVKDIILDLRNQEILRAEEVSKVYRGKYHDVLTESKNLLFYPLIDRLRNSFFSRLLTDTAKDQQRAPGTITLGHGMHLYVDQLASIYAVAMFNGSLTYLLALQDMMKMLLLFSVSRYPDYWYLKILLLKLYVYGYDSGANTKFLNGHNEILAGLNADEAEQIAQHAESQPMNHERWLSRCEALRVVGYYLTNDQFTMQWNRLKYHALDWFDLESPPVVFGEKLFLCLNDIPMRIPDRDLAEIAIKCMKNDFRRFYSSLFKLLAFGMIDITKLTKEMALALVSEVVKIVNDDDQRNGVLQTEAALIVMRNQDRSLTESLDLSIKEKMPIFYAKQYHFATNDLDEKDIIQFILNDVSVLNRRNDTQGIGGQYVYYGDQLFRRIHFLLQKINGPISEIVGSAIFNMCSRVLRNSGQSASEKIEAANLLLYLLPKLDTLSESKINDVKNFLYDEEVIKVGSGLMSALKREHFVLNVLLLQASLNIDITAQLVEVMAELGSNTFSTRHASSSFLSYLITADGEVDPLVEIVILQNAVVWSSHADLSVRRNAVRIMIQLLDSPVHRDTLCKKLRTIFDSDIADVKLQIIYKLDILKQIDEATYDYILEKAHNDAHYLVRSKVSKHVNNNDIG